MTAALHLPFVPQETPESFVAAMAKAAAQVSVVTTDGPAGRFGITVSAFSSVSADPPMILVCINRRSPAVAAIEENGVFCANLLGDDQSPIANCFAGRAGDIVPYDFDCAKWDAGMTGAPVLSGALANFDCTIDAFHYAGSHRIFIGRVALALSSGAAPLAFSNRAYKGLRPLSAKG